MCSSIDSKSSTSGSSIIDIGKPVDVDNLIIELNAFGGKDQLIMILTRYAGIGKSTAVKVAQQFYFEFYNVVSSL